MANEKTEKKEPVVPVAEANQAAPAEVFIRTDRVITDPNAPDAVQVPEAGIGSSLTPLHGERKTPEESLAG